MADTEREYALDRLDRFISDSQHEADVLRDSELRRILRAARDRLDEIFEAGEPPSTEAKVPSLREAFKI